MSSRKALPYRPCVGVLLFNAERQVFVGKRIDMVQEAWQMPQGGIDRGEDPRDTALRELEEETGVRPDKVEILAETREWLRYDLPPHLVRRVWRGRYGGRNRNGSPRASSAPMPTSTSGPRTPSSAIGAGRPSISSRRTWFRSSGRSTKR